jgi:hypothetical protein
VSQHSHYEQPYNQQQYGQGASQQQYQQQQYHQNQPQQHHQPHANQQQYQQQQYDQQPYQQQYQQQYGQPQFQGAQQGYQQQYQAPQQQAGYQGQGVSCRLCGSGPAAPATFRAVVGAVFMHTIWTAHGPYCRDCGLATFRRQTTKTLAGGWCSVGAIVATPIFMLLNINARGKVAGLPAPQPRADGRGQAPLDPGPPVFHRPGAYVYPVLAGFLLLAIIVSNLAS